MLKAGQKVLCVKMFDQIGAEGRVDEQARNLNGKTGIVTDIDGAGQIHVLWENGSTLALIPGVDEFKAIGDDTSEET